MSSLILLALLVFVARTIVDLPQTLRKFRVLIAYCARRRQRRRLTTGLETLAHALDDGTITLPPETSRAVRGLLIDLDRAALADVTSAAAVVTRRQRFFTPRP